MLRLFTSLGFHGLCRCSHSVASRATKRQLISFLPVCHHRVSILARHFNTGSPAWSSAAQSNGDSSGDVDKIDLDKWKSIMKSKAAVDEKHQGDDDDKGASDDDDDDDDDDDYGDDDENLKEPGGDSKDGSSLKATRDLVVMWRQAGKLVPEQMTDEEVHMLAELNTKSAMKKYLKFLAIKEKHKKKNREKQQQKKIAREAMREEKRQEEPQSMLTPQFYRISMDKQVAWKCAQAMLFNQPLVFDMSYESIMTRRELGNTVSQLLEVEGWNRRATEPYHLHYCNLQLGGAYEQELIKRYGARTWDRLLITSTDRHYVDMFPHEQLVYLTSNSPNVLRTFDHSKVYIIGALVDRNVHSGLSLANAKRLNLATARLPLDEFLHWEVGGKNLTLDQMIRIMLTIKETGKWEEALKYVPQRKHDGFHEQRSQKMMISDRATSHGPREDGGRPLRSGERNTERTFNKSQSLYRSHNEPRLTSRDRMGGLPSDRGNKPAASRVRTSFKKNLEERIHAGKSKMLRDDK